MITDGFKLKLMKKIIDIELDYWFVIVSLKLQSVMSLSLIL